MQLLLFHKLLLLLLLAKVLHRQFCLLYLMLRHFLLLYLRRKHRLLQPLLLYLVLLLLTPQLHAIG